VSGRAASGAEIQRIEVLPEGFPNREPVAEFRFFLHPGFGPDAFGVWAKGWIRIRE
jgi:hypothetical protein